MNAARRNLRRRDWPRGLYEPRPGYYVFRCPDGRVMPLGRIPLAHAKAEAMAANQHLADAQPSLVERLTGAGHTVAQLLAKMSATGAKNTEKTRRSLDKKIVAAMGSMPCGQVTTRHVADAIESEVAAGKQRSAQSLRSRMIDVFGRGVELGWLDSNPATATRAPKVVVKRGRLTLETYLQIYAQAPKVNEWLALVMRLALLTGADRSTIASLQRSCIDDEWLTFVRPKTRARIAVPLRIRLDVVGWTLGDVLAHRTGVISPWIVHHVEPHGNAPVGSPVFVDAMSRAFTRARELTGIPDDAAPTLHEIRSLSKRLYEAQGGVDTKALLGHASEKTARLYADPRGIEPIRVRVA